MSAPSDPADLKSAIAGVFDRSSATYEQVGPQFFAPIGRELVRRAELAPGERVLDLGCGRGHCLLPAAEAVGPEGLALGLDLAPGMVAETAAEAERRGLAWVSVRIGDAAEPEVEPAAFDVVQAGLLIFFMPGPGAALRAWARALRPGGRLAFSTFRAQDANFEQAMKTLAGFLPEGSARPAAPSADLFRAAEAITDLVNANGFIEVRHTEAAFQTRFSDPGQWWDWVWSHGGRGVVERLPADRVDAARAAAYAVIERCRTTDGELVLDTTVRYTTARRPA